jgi:LAO/AO transport system kinase
VNKADREGADRTVADIESMLGLHSYKEGEWRPPIVRTQATSGDGLAELDAEIVRFRGSSAAVLTTRRRQRAEAQVRAILADRLMKRVESTLDTITLERLVDRIAARQTDPYSAAAEILESQR